MDLEKLERRIGVQFRNKGLLTRAMRHSSFANERQMGALESNERLEFLGDAVLELVTSEFLYEQYPQMEEGDATKMRASIVCEPSLAFCARAIPLGDYILLGKGEEASGGRQRASITS
ncbi:MAG: ribonuclease III, partial [Lachnospiraceae bacterium]|nr:ribonuclease III [Lachnospiraceae bacterium]